MRILQLGASGFIGSAVARALLADGHSIRAVGRDLRHGRRLLPEVEWVRCDLRDMTDPAPWRALLDGIDTVINTSGVLQTGLRDDVPAVQDGAIRALIDAAHRSGVRNFVQVSAAGAESHDSAFMRSKASADAALASSGLSHTIVRPGLVIGRNAFGGTELLRTAAGLPVAVKVTGTGPIQCIALSDVVEAVRSASTDRSPAGGSFDLLEREGRTLGEIIALHRQWLGLPPPRLTWRVPVGLLKPASLAADALGWLGWRSPLRGNAVAALVRGVRGDASQATSLLSREPRALPEILSGLGPAGKADRWHARLAALYPLALASLVVLWAAGGLVGLLRLDTAAALLMEAGFGAGAARLAVVTGSLADLAIGAGILFRPTLKLSLTAGAAVASGYALAAALVRPDLWLDPLGAMVKIVPIVALSLMCLAMAEER
jgi:uncharacterized protein YbjT (DUF2867 family)